MYHYNYIIDSIAFLNIIVYEFLKEIFIIPIIYQTKSFLFLDLWNNLFSFVLRKQLLIFGKNLEIAFFVILYFVRILLILTQTLPIKTIFGFSVDLKKAFNINTFPSIFITLCNRYKLFFEFDVYQIIF